MPTTNPNTITVRTLGRLAAAGALAAAVAACSDTAHIFKPSAPSNAPFMARYVALGNSITAGYQSGGINDSTQRESYARLLALQVPTTYNYVSIPNGCAPPLTSLTGTRLNAVACPGLSSAQSLINNVAVPGATTADGFTPITGSYSGLTSFILGGLSQADRALALNPTFVSVWLGNNDVLAVGVGGVPNALTLGSGSSAVVVSPGATPVTTFNSNYDQTLARLDTDKGLRGALIGVVDVSNAPVLFPAESLITNAAFKAAFEQYTGRNAASTNQFVAAPVTVDANCTGSTALLSFLIVPEIIKWRSDPQTDPTKPRAGHPPLITCVKSTTTPPLGNVWILDATERAFVTDLVNQYNAHIKAAADARGWVYLDPNPLLAQLKTDHLIPAFPSLTTPTQPYGEYISIDGIHPTGKSHVLIANALIDAINAKYGSSIPKISVATP